eukprot:scaffold4151_cov162-Amphora_coffeaeformis.AAC.7
MMKITLRCRPSGSTWMLWKSRFQASSSSIRGEGASRLYENVPVAFMRGFSSTTTSFETATTKNYPKPEFYVPRHQRDVLRPIFEIDSMAGETRLVRNNRLCPTRELYFLPLQWGRHKSPYRKFRHMRNLFRSAPFQRLLFPDLTLLSAVSAGLIYYNEVVAAGAADLVIALTPTAFAGATTAIGLLAGFRVSNSYGRYREGRHIWSDAQSAIRDLARQVCMWVPTTPTTTPGGENEVLDTTRQARLLRLCQAFPVTLMFHLNDKGSHHNMKRNSRLGDEQFYDRVFAEFRAELYDVYQQKEPTDGNDDSDNTTTTQYDCSDPQTITNPTLRRDFERLCRVKVAGGSVPLEVLTCMSEAIAELSPDLHPVYVRELDDKVQRLTKSLGGGERILKTPLPTGFTRHSSRAQMNSKRTDDRRANRIGRGAPVRSK